MARLETQINQIYLTDRESKKSSLILYEEQLTNSLQLYMVAELSNMQKKSESTDLKKISEIILRSFRGNKKLPAETLFETSLSQINQNLADLAHEGRKSWVGKLSCLICIKGLDNNIYLANNGQTQAWLKRRSQIMEVLPSEKRGTHPLKTFVNFTQGKLTDADSLILTTSNIFDYISFELFGKMLEQMPLDQACLEISKILQDSKASDTAFGSFMMHFTKEPIEEIAPTINGEEIYAPLPEEESNFESKPKLRLSIPKLPSINFSLPAFNWPQVNLNWLKKIRPPEYFQNLSRAGKFFFISFAIFLLLFLINLGIYAGKLKTKKTENRITQLVDKVNDDIAQAQSALIYKDETQALEHLNQTLTDLDALAKLDKTKADELQPKLEQIKTVLNKITTAADPTVLLDLKHHPTYLAATPIGLLFGNADSNSLSRYDNKNLTDYFLLNSLEKPLTSVNYTPTTGIIVASGNQIFRIDQTLKEFQPIASIEGGELKQMLVANNAIYVLDPTHNQIVKIAYSNKYQKQVSALGDFAAARSFGVDKDLYVLYPDKLIKFVSGQPQEFPMPNMTDALTNGDKIQVASNLYILEGNKKRVIVLGKNGSLNNQIYFPSMTNPTDFYVDEAGRQLYVLDDNKLYKITF